MNERNSDMEATKRWPAKNTSFRIFLRTFFCLLLPVTLLADGTVERDFTLKVLPLLKSKCFACHGDDPKKIKGDLNMLSREGLLKRGGNLTNVLVPGKAKASQMFIAVTWENKDLEMPPQENDRLTKEQSALVRAWIDAGAPWPSEAEQKKLREAEWSVVSNADGVIMKTSGGLADAWTYRRYKPEDVWAFQPVKKPDLDKGIGTKESHSRVPIPVSKNPVDNFIAAKLAKARTQPAAAADPRTLIRRATFDLIGLPPTPEETQEFLAAWKKDSQKAWENLIDRLLASPHYGERWAQHWLDVARYADTGGMANDFERSNMGRYRDYVIRSFNTDKPYDRFVLEQLAGDQLADASALPRLGDDAQKVAEVRRKGHYTEEEAEWIVATGFLRMGPWDNAMVKDEEARQIYRDDLVTYELAYRMQMEVPDVIDLKGEPETMREMYGLNDKSTAAFGRQCLLARRLVKKGVRFVQIFSGGWDSHEYLERAHNECIRGVDKPMAALIRDLKQRGMLKDTLVIWCGESGRTPDNNKRGGVYSLGRGHNAHAMTMLFAGGDVKPGIVGATDELGLKAVDVVHPIRDLHVTLLHLLGLDDNKLTFYHAGRYKQLSQFGGQVIKELIA